MERLIAMLTVYAAAQCYQLYTVHQRQTAFNFLERKRIALNFLINQCKEAVQQGQSHRATALSEQISKKSDEYADLVEQAKRKGLIA